MFFASIFALGQFVPETIPGSNDIKRVINLYKETLFKNRNIQSENTCIEEYSLYGSTYLLISGGEGLEIDNTPLLVKPLYGGQAKEICNLYPNEDYIEGKNIIDVFRGCILTRIKFFHEAQFVRIIWKKFPEAEYWKPKISY